MTSWMPRCRRATPRTASVRTFSGIPGSTRARTPAPRRPRPSPGPPRRRVCHSFHFSPSAKSDLISRSGQRFGLDSWWDGGRVGSAKRSNSYGQNYPKKRSGIDAGGLAGSRINSGWPQLPLSLKPHNVPRKKCSGQAQQVDECAALPRRWRPVGP